MKQNWNIEILDQPPAMTHTKLPFTGTYQQAVTAAKSAWLATHRPVTIVTAGDVYYWYRIDHAGHCVNRNSNSGVRDHDFIGEPALQMSDVDRVKECLAWLSAGNLANVQWTREVQAEGRKLGLMPPLKPEIGCNIANEETAYWESKAMSRNQEPQI
jgi:hypothetical protein